MEEIVEAGVEAALDNLHTAQVAIVTGFDAASHTVSVQPINKLYRVNDDKDFETRTPPIINSVPVQYAGSGGNRLTFPVKKGSLVLLVHLHSSNEVWQHSDGSKVVDPGDQRRHDYNDVVAIPCVLTVPNAKKGGSAKVVDGAIVVHVEEKLFLGGDAGTHPVARDIDVKAGVKGVLTDSVVMGAFATYQAALVSGIGVPAAKLALESAIDTYFTGHSIGSSVVEAK